MQLPSCLLLLPSSLCPVPFFVDVSREREQRGAAAAASAAAAAAAARSFHCCSADMQPQQQQQKQQQQQQQQAGTMKRSPEEDPLAFLARRKKSRSKASSSSSSSSSSARNGTRLSGSRRDSVASAASSALFTERRRRRPSEEASLDGSSSSQAAAAAAAGGSSSSSSQGGPPGSSQASFNHWSQGRDTSGAPRGGRGPLDDSQGGGGPSQGSAEAPPTCFPRSVAAALAAAAPAAFAAAAIAAAAPDACAPAAIAAAASAAFAAIAAAAPAAFSAYADAAAAEGRHCSSKTHLLFSGVGGGIAADAPLIAALEDLLDVSCYCCCCCCCCCSRCAGGACACMWLLPVCSAVAAAVAAAEFVAAALYEACGERLRQMLLLLFEATPQGGPSGGPQGPRLGLGSAQTRPLLAIPGASIRGDAAAVLASADTSGAKAAAGAAVAAAAAAAPNAAQGRVMQLQQRDLTEAALVSREAAKALLQEMQIQAEEIVEIWPLRRSLVFLSQPQDAVSFCTDAFLLYRASSVHMVPCLLSVSLPSLDLLEAEGVCTPESTAGDILWLPLWCAETLGRQGLIKVMLPPFLQSNQVKGYLRAEERHKRGLEPLPVFFFEAARLLLFNPLTVQQQQSLSFLVLLAAGLVLQLWDRRQAKIAAALVSANLEESVVRMDHIQPSETYMLLEVLALSHLLSPLQQQQQQGWMGKGKSSHACNVVIETLKATKSDSRSQQQQQQQQQQP
ncbi:hypothetical protein Emed_002426 [Eimeria media]